MGLFIQPLPVFNAVIRGNQGTDVKRVQEWLTLRGFAVSIDGDFGPATDAAVRRFQRRAELEVDGKVGSITLGKLEQPLLDACRKIDPKPGETLGELTVRYAQQHLAQHPREVGGQNRGPWVRLYMLGREGTEWAWCAGFASYCLRQAAMTLGVQVPIRTSFSCDSLAANASRVGRFLEQPQGAERDKVKPGAFFLCRRSDDDWTHVGIVTEVGEEAFETIEGNTNDDGHREGYEVCARTRGFRGMDFILI